MFNPDLQEKKLLAVDTMIESKIKTATLVWSVVIVVGIFAIAEIIYQLVTSWRGA